MPTRLPARLLRLAGDDRLVAHVRAGSAAAFEVLYDRHHRGVLAFCRHMLGSVEEAEDAVQHTFLAAYRELVGSQKAIRLRPWLYAIARNRCLSVLRRRREQPLAEHAEPATEHLAAEVQRREDLRHLLHDVARLPDDQRAALVLAELGDVSHEEIADVIGCGRDKVKALVFQARTSLNASRAARETSCHEIREQLANLRGGALRRNSLRRHLRECAGCQEFHARVREQRSALALVLPVAPSLGLKGAVLGSALGGGAAATGAGMAGGLAAKALVAVAVAGGGTTAGVVTVNEIAKPDRQARTAEPIGTGALRAGDGGATTVAAPSVVGRGEEVGGEVLAPAAGGDGGRIGGVRERDALAWDTDRGSSTAPGHTDRGRSSAPGQTDRGDSSAPGHGDRGRSTAPGHNGRGRSTAPGQADRGGSSAPGHGDRGRSTAPGHTDRGRSTAPGRADGGRSSAPGYSGRGRSATPGRADRGGSPARGRTDGGRSTGSRRADRGGSSAPDRASAPGQAKRGDSAAPPAGKGEAKAQGSPESKESTPPPAAETPPAEEAQPDAADKQPKP